MKIFCEDDDRILKIRLEGELDHHAARGAMHEVGKLIDTRLPSKCTLDFRGVSFMDSSGIALILSSYRRMYELGGEMTIVNLTPQAQKVFSAAGISRIVAVE